MFKFMTRAYRDDGDTKSEYYTDDLHEAIDVYLSKKASSKKRMSDPTLWALFDGNYTRVHDFNFNELTDETYQKYITERVIWSDYLLQELTE